MSVEAFPTSPEEKRAILCLCVLAAFADGSQQEDERARILEILSGFAESQTELTAAYQEVLGGNWSLTRSAAQLQTASAKALGYEMAVCVCNADGALNESEQKFLTELRAVLRLDPNSTTAHQQAAQAIALQPLNQPLPPVIDVNREPELDRLILNAAILNGALELLPHALATMAIVPLQMRMVYRIGHRYGFELDQGHIKDFLATVGVGLTSQVIGGFAERLLGGFARKLAGGLLGGLAGQAAGSAFGFASTYALGQVARKYYASGRSLDATQLKEVFSAMLQEARFTQSRYTGDIAAKARQVNISELLPLIRQQ
jgi:uncharacterized protein (DUF697 family)/tellurite resistance protein